MMMTSSSKQKDFPPKQEGETDDGGKLVSKGEQPSSSRQWSGFRNPRIVRVSRTFGGKDRHSKVCTIRGLRDRRIRLSVPTAIQLYDLQDRLGLNQPSKVIDWLLDATKDDIDMLPPLQIPQGFGQFHQPLLVSHESNPSQSSFHAPFFEPNSIFMKAHGGEDQCMQLADQKRYWDNMDSATAPVVAEKGKRIKVNELQENQDGVGDSSQKLFPLSNHASLLPAGLLNNSAMPFNSYYHWEPSNLSLSQFGNHGFLHQPETFFNGGNTNLPLPFFCPPTMPPLFPTYPPYGTTAPGSDSRQMNHFQLLSSNSQHAEPNSFTMISSSPMKHLSLNVNASGLFSHAQNDDQSHAGEDHNADF